MLNTLVSVHSDALAHAHSYVALYSAPQAIAPPPWTAQAPALIGTFDDVLVRQDDHWLFKQRLGALLVRVEAH